MNAEKENREIEYSLVVPMYNEEANVPELIADINKFISSHGRKWEIIFVDDGSRDGTWEALCRAREQMSCAVRCLRLARNYGQTVALRAGIDAAQGRVIVTMDGDLQNDPSDIPKLLKEIDEGADVVSGWRRKRMDRFLTRKLPSWLGNWFISLITGVKLHDFGCTLKAYRSDIIKNIPLYGEMHRLIPALADWMGAEIVEVEVGHRKREAGESKYSMTRVFAVIIDIITLRFFYAYSSRPTHVFGMWGIVSMLLSLVSMGVVVYMKYAIHFNMTGNPFLIISIMLMIVGVQLIALGLLGEVNVRTYYESLHKPPYRIKDERGE